MDEAKVARIKELRERDGIGLLAARRQVEREDRKIKRAQLRNYVHRFGVTRDAFNTLLDLLEEID